MRGLESSETGWEYLERVVGQTLGLKGLEDWELLSHRWKGPFHL
jgi:hypothetical protein